LRQLTLADDLEGYTEADISSNKIRLEDKGVHDWYRFVLSFPPHLVRRYLEQFGANSTSLVLDPFCGTGTTLVESKKLQIPSIGIEAHIMPYFATKVKINWKPNPVDLLGHAKLIGAIAYEKIKSYRSKSLTLPDEKKALLLSGSISPLPLHKSLVLLECINAYHDTEYSDHELLALAKALIGPIGNLHFRPEVGVSYAKTDADVIGSWFNEIQIIARDLKELQRNKLACDSISSTVYRYDSRLISEIVGDKKVDIVITSPPYPNEKDYTRTTRLESVVLGFINSKLELREQKNLLLRSNTRNVYKSDDDDTWVASFQQIQDLADNIERRRIDLNKTSGFERLYGRLTKLYFGGMARHLSSLREILNPGAHLAYVLGDQASYFRVKIRTAEIVGKITESLGYTIEGRDLFRTRLATATKEQLREEVLILRWQGVVK